MICSKEELRLEDRSEGIWNFEPDLVVSVGTDLTTLLEYDDTVFDIKVPSDSLALMSFTSTQRCA